MFRVIVAFFATGKELLDSKYVKIAENGTVAKSLSLLRRNASK
mgnify:FL=1